MSRLSLLVVLLAVLVPTVPAGSDDDKAYQRALRFYRAYVKRPSFYKRCLGRDRLMGTGETRALQVLVDDYDAADSPRDMAQYWLVTQLTKYYGGEQAHRDVFRGWREGHARPTDAWLWYRTLVHETAADGPKAALEIVRSDRQIHLRVAALEALIVHGGDELLGLIPELLGKLPIDPMARAMMVESLAAALATQRWRIKEPEFEAPAKQLIQLMDDKQTLMRTKHVMARYLGKLLDTKDRFVRAEPWLNALLFERTGGEIGSGRGYGHAPTFGGIEATGDRILFVIDMSDSMLKELEPKILAELRKLPAKPRVPPSRKKNPFKAEGLVDWKGVKTRFDAAREMLKFTLISLPKEKEFAVVVFGDKAELLKACSRGLKPAKPSYVKKVIRELDGVRAGPETAKSPHGELRGATNFHGGAQRAFQVIPKGLVGSAAYVDPEAYLKGAETIFLLSDGDPTTDDWVMEDQRDENDRAGNAESGGQVEDTGSKMLKFPGPYAGHQIAQKDIARLNLFRKCEIHCIGLGEANSYYLKSIAELGLGRAKMVGVPEED